MKSQRKYKTQRRSVKSVYSYLNFDFIYSKDENNFPHNDVVFFRQKMPAEFIVEWRTPDYNSCDARCGLYDTLTLGDDCSRHRMQRKYRLLLLRLSKLRRTVNTVINTTNNKFFSDIVARLLRLTQTFFNSLKSVAVAKLSEDASQWNFVF